jgi:hypothetical protein
MTEFDRHDVEPGGPTDDTNPPARTRWGRKRSASRTERSTAVQMPSTPVFQASPTTVAAALAKLSGDTLATRVAWGADDAVAVEAGPDAPVITAPPVFIVGGGPADRARLRAALEPHANLSFGPETDVLAGMTRVVEDAWDTLVHEGYPRQYWYKSVADHFAVIPAGRAAHEDKGRWVELVDDAALPLTTLDRLFPTCRIVHIVADGLGRRNGRATRRHAASLSAGRYCEVRGRDLEADPAAVRAAVLEFLGEAAGVTSA